MKLKFLILSVALLSACGPGDKPGQPTVEVWKSATCKCCSKWVEHLRQSGFNVTVHNQSDVSPIKAKLGVPERLAACHTGAVGGYVVEGHVPAEDIKRMLAEKPPIKGLAVPGMPVGSPGMEQGERHDPYDTLSIAADGTTRAFAQHGDAAPAP